MEPGGFLQPHLPSPPQSSHGSPALHGPILPETRSYPLKRGSGKESAVIDHVDGKLLEISRRYEKRFNSETEHNTGSNGKPHGYESFGEAARDLESITDVVWVTGTPILQTSYLLSIALAVLTYLPAFPFHPRPTFRILNKLDLAFASLLQGSNVQTGQRLAGFEGLFGARGIDTTKRVRMRGIVERTRVVVVEVASRGSSITDNGSIQQSSAEEDMIMEDETGDDNEYRDIAGEDRSNWEMEVARVYERTIVLLGESLEPSAANSLE